MKLYLDNCCFNRPFDDQSQLRIRLETEAKSDYFLTTDDGIIKLNAQINEITIIDPIGFIKQVT